MANVSTQRKIQFAADPTDPRHGNPAGYKSLGCRCDPCTLAAVAAATAHLHNRELINRQAADFLALKKRHAEELVSWYLAWKPKRNERRDDNRRRRLASYGQELAS
jgi:hypothetical protein